MSVRQRVRVRALCRLFWLPPARANRTGCKNKGPDEWAATRGLHSAEWHRKKHTEEDTIEHYRHIDAELAKLPEDVYMIGSLYWDFVPDAIVLIDPVIHRERVRKRHDLHWHTVAEVVRDLQEKALQYGVHSFDKASEYVVHHRRSSRRGAFNDATAR